MNTYKLRNCMKVISYGIGQFAGITYLRYADQCTITLTHDKLLTELISIGSLDEGATIEDLGNYTLSQWDALNIAIRHESDKDMDETIKNSDIGKAFDKILNNKYDN